MHRPLTGNPEFSLAHHADHRLCSAPAVVDRGVGVDSPRLGTVRAPGVYVPGLVDARRGVQVSRRSGAGLLPGRLRAAELIGALSLATDFGVGEPLEHGLRTTVIGVRLAESLGLGEEDRRAVYYVALLRYAGCTAESHLDAALFGDEIAVRAAMAPALFGSRAELFLAIARTMHAGEPARWRAVAVARALVQLRKTFRKGAAGHCEVTQAHALRLGLGTEIQAALGDVFERWDGNGWPAGRRGDQVPLPVRLMQVAEDADLQHGLGLERRQPLNLAHQFAHFLR